MSQMIYVGGSQSAGKTLVILGLLQAFLKEQRRAIAWKPIDLGRRHYDAADQPSDGERFQQLTPSVHPNLCNTMLLHETFPPVLSAQYEGLRIKQQSLEEHYQQLTQHFDWVLTEGLHGLCTPFSENQTQLQYLEQWQPKVLWVTSIGESALAETLMSLQLLQQANIEISGVILNNHPTCRHGDLIRYQWTTIEEQYGVRVIGLLPPLDSGLEQPQAIESLLYQHLETPFWEQWNAG